MKRWIAGILACLMILVAAGCGKTETKEPEITKMRAICELAVMECYYHNVAKFKEDGGKILFFNKKDTEFWIEYSGIVKLGVDISQVKMEIREEQVTVTLPPAQVLSCRVDSSTLNAEKFIVAQNSAKIKAEQEIYAFEQAQAEMEQQAAANTLLLAEAQQRAQTLLENYIQSIGQAAGRTYTIRWVYTEAEMQEPSAEGDNKETAES